MSADILIAGGGLGGLAAAVACAEAGAHARVLEQAQALSEAGAGIQLGPNATAILRRWGIAEEPLQAARPQALRVRDARSGRELARLQLGRSFEARYGAPYLTAHRADLQSALLEAATARGVAVRTGARVSGVQATDTAVRVATTAAKDALEADALVGADGLWSEVRAQVAADGPPRRTGHLAYRSLVAQAQLPAALRSSEVTAWLAPGLHAVSYPVRGAEWLNVVCVVEGALEGDARGWDHAAVGRTLEASLASACTALRDTTQAAGAWRLWALHDRPAVRGAADMARGRIALLGDAAHPMLPYLAQGAGMAIEDACELQRVLAAVRDRAMDLPTALQRYALNRWQRCARVQRRSRRNGWIFHAGGLVRAGRDLSLRLLGERLLDLPWLYGQRG